MISIKERPVLFISAKNKKNILISKFSLFKGRMQTIAQKKQIKPWLSLSGALHLLCNHILPLQTALTLVSEK